MIIVNKKFNPKGFVREVDRMKWRPWNRYVARLIFHHTSSPVEIWEGSASMLHYWTLYRSRGWKAGPHIFIAPDGIWFFTDMRKQGKHAGPRGNKGSVGIEIVGRYHDGPPTDENMCKNIALVTAVLLKKFGLRREHVFNHMSFDPGSFCSKWIDPNWIIDNMYSHTEYLKKCGL